MSTVIATTVKTEPTTDTLTLGGTGDSVVISGNILTVNTLQDVGGNTIFVSDGSGTLTSMSANFTGVTKKISEQTVSNQASISFTTGLDSTYDVYFFRFINVQTATADANFGFNGSTDGGSNYNVTKTTTCFLSERTEAGGTGFEYRQDFDIASGTGDAVIARGLREATGDESCAGRLYFFNPSSTTFTKHFYSELNAYVTGGTDGGTDTFFAAGYYNTTSAINAVTFKMSTGNFDGTIAMYGISKS